MTIVSLNNLLTYLQGLSLTESNKRWLAEKLVEPSNAAENKRQYEQLKANLTEAFHELDEHRKGKLEFEPIEKLLDEL